MITYPPVDTIVLTWDDYHLLFGHITKDPHDLVGKHLKSPRLFPIPDLTIFVNSVDYTRDHVTATYTILEPQS